MKPTTFLLLSFLLLTLATKSLIANQEFVGLREPVYDVEGDMLRPGTEYYIMPAIWSVRRGGLTVGRAPRNATGCPLDVIQQPFAVISGRPVMFTPVDSKTIRVSTDLQINFTCGCYPTCVESTYWKVVKSSNSDKQWSVRIIGARGNPRSNILGNWGELGNPSSNILGNRFQIEKINNPLNHYKFTYCPTETCNDLSIYSEGDGTRSLVLNGGEPFEVVFYKAAPESINLVNAE